ILSYTSLCVSSSSSTLLMGSFGFAGAVGCAKASGEQIIKIAKRKAGFFIYPLILPGAATLPVTLRILQAILVAFAAAAAAGATAAWPQTPRLRAPDVKFVASP